MQMKQLGLLLVVLSVLSHSVFTQDCAVYLNVESYGFNEGNNFVFSLNDVPVEFDVETQSVQNFFRGLCVYQTNENGDSLYQQCFDTWGVQSEDGRLREYLQSLPDGTLVAFAVKDEASKHLSAETQAELKKFGFPADWSFNSNQYFRGSLAAIGVKGSEAGSAQLAQDTDGAGGSQVGQCLSLVKECALYLNVESYGFNEGNSFLFSLNDEAVEFDVETQSVQNFFRGLCVYQTNEYGDSLYQQCFDTWGVQSEDGRLREYLQSLPDGTKVAFAVKDEASKHLSAETQAELKKFGFPADWSFNSNQYFRGSLAAVGVKGSEAGSAELAQDTDGAGGSQVGQCLSYAGDCAKFLKVESYGFNEGNNFVFTVNGQKVEYDVDTDSIQNFFRGLCVYQTNEQLEPLYKQCFDTWGVQSEDGRLREYLQSLSDGTFVAFAVKDEASKHLSAETQAELKKFGFPADWSFNSDQYFRGSLAAIGVKGSEAGSALLTQDTDGAGGSEVEKCFAKFGSESEPEPSPEPEPFTSDCVVVFAECNFQGESVKVCDKNADIPLTEVKSIFVPADTTFYFYNSTNYEGTEVALSSSVECYQSSSEFFNFLSRGHSFLHKHARNHHKRQAHHHKRQQKQKAHKISGVFKKN